MLLVSVFVLLALPLIEALQSDRLLPREYYESIYKNKYDADLKIGDRTPWDIGNNRPQPAVVRAYNEGKIRGNILDAGVRVFLIQFFVNLIAFSFSDRPSEYFNTPLFTFYIYIK